MYDIMVLYILRHEKRDLDKYDFFSPLNMIGKHYSKIFQYSVAFNFFLVMLLYEIKYSFKFILIVV